MNYEAEYGLSDDDILLIDKKIKEANIIFERISRKGYHIKDSEAIETYLNSL